MKSSAQLGGKAAGWIGALAAAAICAAAAGQTLRIGGFDLSRGGPEGNVATGHWFEGWIADLGTRFEPAVVSSTPVLTGAYLQTVDILLITVVYTGGNDEVTPLSAQEQAALLAFVRGGGRAVILTDNAVGYFASSNSMLNPFGLSSVGLINGTQFAETVSPPPACSVVEGPFGVVGLVQGGYNAWFSDTGTATVLANWQANGQPAMASGHFGAGRAIFTADAGLVSEINFTAQRNAMWWLGIRPATVPAAVNACTREPVTLATAFPAWDGATYQWFRGAGELAGETGRTLTLSGAALASGAYSCHVTHACGSFRTYPSTVSVCFADFNCDGFLDFFDADDFVGAFEGGEDRADFNGDGFLDFFDAADFVEAFEAGC